MASKNELRDSYNYIWSTFYEGNVSLLEGVQFVGSVSSRRNTYDVYNKGTVFFTVEQDRKLKNNINIILWQEIKLLLNEINFRGVKAFRASELLKIINFDSDSAKIIDLVGKLDPTSRENYSLRQYARVLTICYILCALGKLRAETVGNKVVFFPEEQEAPTGMMSSRYLLNLRYKGNRDGQEFYEGTGEWLIIWFNLFRGSASVVSRQEIEKYKSIIDILEYPYIDSQIVLEKIKETDYFNNLYDGLEERLQIKRINLIMDALCFQDILQKQIDGSYYVEGRDKHGLSIQDLRRDRLQRQIDDSKEKTEAMRKTLETGISEYRAPAISYSEETSDQLQLEPEPKTVNREIRLQELRERIQDLKRRKERLTQQLTSKLEEEKEGITEVSKTVFIRQLDQKIDSLNLDIIDSIEIIEENKPGVKGTENIRDINKLMGFFQLHDESDQYSSSFLMEELNLSKSTISTFRRMLADFALIEANMGSVFKLNSSGKKFASFLPEEYDDGQETIDLTEKQRELLLGELALSHIRSSGPILTQIILFLRFCADSSLGWVPKRRNMSIGENRKVVVNKVFRTDYDFQQDNTTVTLNNLLRWVRNYCQELGLIEKMPEGDRNFDYYTLSEKGYAVLKKIIMREELANDGGKKN